MRPEASCALALSIALLTVAGCEDRSSSQAVAAVPADAPMAPGVQTNTTGPDPEFNDFVRAWTVNSTIGDAFTCRPDNNTPPCHFGNFVNEGDDKSEWIIRLTQREPRVPADCNNDASLRQFNLIATKTTLVADDAPVTTTVAYGVLCEDKSNDAQISDPDIVGKPKFRHGDDSPEWKEHDVRMTLLKKNDENKPFRVRIDMNQKTNVHIHNGSGHGED